MNLRQVAEDTVVVTHRCDRCRSYIEVLHLTGFLVSWSGRRVTVDKAADAAYMCHRCRIELLPDALRANAEQHFGQLLQIRDRLGIPEEVTLHVFQGQGREDRPKDRDFRLMLFAVQVRHWPLGSPIPCLRVPGADRPTYEFALPMVALSQEDLPVALECRWSVTDPLSPATALEIVGWRKAESLSQVHRLVDGLALLRDFPPMRRGRRKDASKTVPPDVFAEQLPRVYREFLDTYGSHPSSSELAAVFGVSLATFKRYKHTYLDRGGQWPPISDF